MNIVPSGRPEIAIHYGDPSDSYLNYFGEVKTGYLYGPHNKPGYFIAKGRIKCLCVLFKPYGAYKIFGHPQVEFRNHAVNLEVLCGMEGLNVIEQVSLAKTPQDKASVMDLFLKRQHKKAKKRSVNIDEALNIILSSKGRIRIRDICKYLNVSIKTLERQYKSVLGYNPKEFASIIRVNHAYRLIHSNTYRDVMDIAFECGYYDQSHFINEFKHFTNFTPDKILGKPEEHVIYLNRMYTY